MVKVNGYMYEIKECYDQNGRNKEITEDEELQAAEELDEFLSGSKVYTSNDVKKLLDCRKSLGLIEDVVHELYDAYYDLVFFGKKNKNWFLETFHLSEQELGIILI